MNAENQALRICIPREDHQQIRAFQSVQNLSTGREDNLNLVGTEGGHQMAAATNTNNMGLGSSHHNNIVNQTVYWPRKQTLRDGRRRKSQRTSET